MKVVVFGGYAPSLFHFRGAMMRTMVEAGHQVTGLAPGGDETLVANLASIGVDFRSVPLERTSLNPIGDWRSLQAITRILRKIQPDLLLSYTIKPVIYGSLAAARAGVPHRHAMITGLGSSLQGNGVKMTCMAALAKWLYRRGLARNEGVFFQNPDDHAFFRDHHLLPSGCRITLINGSGVDLEHFQPAPLPADDLTFLMIARMTRDKGVMEYVEAARVLKSRFPSIHVQLLGGFDTNPTSISEKTIQSFEREGIIEYLGKTLDVRPFLAKAHVVVLPSYGEGTPRSVLEAMAMGRAVVTTSAPGCKETVIHGRSGFLVPVKDSKGLAAAMERFCLDRTLEVSMGRAGRVYAEEKFDVKKVNMTILKALSLF